ncbi:TAXI family TRAP transporter solute-binding subunit [Dethiosulfatarculus sandiegensis]|nr:TAXI family TRAP transporter solute-binding subunit [Dethiosulfatarculus sandiegensis]
MRKLLALTLALGVILCCAPALAGNQITLTWTAGGAGGGWYGMAGGIASIIHQADPDIVIKVVPGGGVKNPAVISVGSADIGWGLPFMNAAAYEGMAPFGQKLKNLRAIAGGMSMNYFHFYVGAESGVKSLDQIFGQKKPIRMAISQAGSSEVWVFDRVLEHYDTNIKDLKDKDFHFARGNYSFQANQFKDNNVDAVWTFLALPGASVTEASVGRDLKLVAFPEDVLNSLAKFGILKGTIPQGTYPKAANQSDVVTARSGSVITVSADMSDDLAYRLTKAFNENVDKVSKVHASLKDYKPAHGVTGCGVPLHPGAIKYYKEKGILK